MRVALVTLLILVGLVDTAAAGMYEQPPGDYGAQWVGNDEFLCHCWNGSYQASGWTIVPIDGSPASKLRIPGVTGDSRVLAAGSVPLLAVTVGSSLAVAAPDGSGFRTLTTNGVPIAWIDNGSRVVYSAGKQLSSIGVDGGDRFRRDGALMLNPAGRDSSRSAIPRISAGARSRLPFSGIGSDP